MSSGTGRRGAAPAGQGLRDALRWLSETGRHDATAVEEACRRFDLSPLDEEFLLGEARRARAAADRGGSSSSGTPAP
jgi:phosphohistidine phosphatase SixA